jgi:hypothetical protein
MHTDLSAREIVESAMRVAAELCIFTNDRFTIETVSMPTDSGEDDGAGQEDAGEEPAQLPMPTESDL